MGIITFVSHYCDSIVGLKKCLQTWLWKKAQNSHLERLLTSVMYVRSCIPKTHCVLILFFDHSMLAYGRLQNDVYLKVQCVGFSGSGGDPLSQPSL